MIVTVRGNGRRMTPHEVRVGGPPPPPTAAGGSPMVPPDIATDESLPPTAALAFAPLHKLAFGVAIGSISGLIFFGLTAIYLLRQPSQPIALGLLGQYFYGYTVSWPGAIVGLLWGSAVGFVIGWFTAFCRNLTLATLLFIARTREELAATRDFLDHI